MKLTSVRHEQRNNGQNRRSVGGRAGSNKAAKRRTEAIRRERMRTQARQGAAVNKTVGPTLKKAWGDRPVVIRPPRSASPIGRSINRSGEPERAGGSGCERKADRAQPATRRGARRDSKRGGT